ncbi:MAG: L,D-transpeptidase family protein [Patescibacteria group bacterium]|nr:L,D-transpeptidase family protein [Patescibacteria group bacterium]
MQNSIFGRAYSAMLIVGVLFLFAPPANASTDTDSDGLSDEQELRVYHTDPLLADTDHDGFFDGQEVRTGYSPLYGNKKKLIDVDSDNDSLNDAWEIAIGTDVANPDTDGDGHRDGTEVAEGYDPLSPAPVKKDKTITISLKNQHLAYAFGNVTLEEFSISSGLPRTPTPKGTFAILDKVPVKHYGGVGFDYPNTKWNLHFTTGKYRYYIHGAYWHDNFGRPMSHGCVNVAYENMERLYAFANIGTKVIIR